MAGPGGARPGAGRPKGSKNRTTLAREAELRKGGLMPLDFLLAIVRNEDEGRERRIDAAKAAAPYCHPRLNAIDHTGNLTINHEQAIADLE